MAKLKSRDICGDATDIILSAQRNTVRGTAMDWYAEARENCDSPIEIDFWVAYQTIVEAALLAEVIRFGDYERVVIPYTGIDEINFRSHIDIRLTDIARAEYIARDYEGRKKLPEMLDYVWMQERIDSYRVDFAICRGRYSVRRIDGDSKEGVEISKVLVVECDGHDYHERTKEQAAKDKSRDRHLVASGFTVMRFTGSELYSDPFARAREVSSYLDSDNNVEHFFSFQQLANQTQHV